MLDGPTLPDRSLIYANFLNLSSVRPDFTDVCPLLTHTEGRCYSRFALTYVILCGRMGVAPLDASAIERKAARLVASMQVNTTRGTYEY
jgi:hypothetical protein